MSPPTPGLKAELLLHDPLWIDMSLDRPHDKQTLAPNAERDRLNRLDTAGLP